MRAVEFRSRRPQDGAVEVIGRVVVADPGGSAVAIGVDPASTAYLERLLADGVPGRDGSLVFPSDGEQLLAALPQAFRGSRLWATSVPSDRTERH